MENVCVLIKCLAVEQGFNYALICRKTGQVLKEVANTTYGKATYMAKKEFPDRCVYLHPIKELSKIK